MNRRDMLQLSLGLAMPALLVLAFPRCRAAAHCDDCDGQESPACAYVTLTPQEELKALASARTSWQLDRGNSRRMRVRVFEDRIPEAPPQTVVGFGGDLEGGGDCRTAEYRPDLLPDTLAAPQPAAIAADTDANDAAPDAFPRDELLRLN